MGACMVIGSAIFSVTLVLTLLYLIGSFFRNVGVSCFYRGAFLLYSALLILCAWLYSEAFFSPSRQWGETVFPMILNLILLFLQYIHFHGAMVIGKKYIYKMGHGFIVRRYSFDQIKKCSGKHETVVRTKWHQRRKTTFFTVEVMFSDGSQGSFSTNYNESPKAKYYLETLRTIRRKR